MSAERGGKEDDYSVPNGKRNERQKCRIREGGRKREWEEGEARVVGREEKQQ